MSGNLGVVFWGDYQKRCVIHDKNSVSVGESE